ncbi:unnamed protein product [Candidula unifasciata]|uniref:Calponin-homology (CH) domain-containing protein n=1 Tax=Candidula unifasciata TaxID=100452 RepID=A0A8S3ZPR1_9EUPU|nr:unnamed protein product [Candidula unifasciata]
MVPYHRSQSRIIKSSGSRLGIRWADVSAVFRYIVWCLAGAVFKLWHLNPVSLILRRWRQLHHLNTRMTLRVRPRLIDLATDFFLSDDRRKRQLLSWVKSILPWLEEEVFDFTACWQDGIALCALMEAISPGACPKFNLLKAHHRVNNCRLGLQLAMRYLHVTELPLSPEEMAIAEEDSEVKICHLVQLLKWKYQKQGSKPACKCQARGTGLKAGIVGKRTKFNILTERLANLDLVIEIRGPNKEVCL